MSISIHEVAKKYSDTLNIKTTVTQHVNVEYVWIDDVSTTRLLSKTQKLPVYFVENPQEIPKWTFSSGNPDRMNKNIGYLHPVLVYKDPIRLEKNVLTLCETYLSKDEPTSNTKNRMECRNIMKSGEVEAHDCRFEIEQEFVFQECPEITTAAQKDSIRKASESFYRACIYMGLSVNSFSIENHPEGFLSYKIGPCNGLQASDELTLTRYILQRVAEEFHLTPCFDRLSGSRSRAHYRFSTQEMRGTEGLEQVKACIKVIRSRCEPNPDIYDSPFANTDNDLFPYDTIVEFLEVLPTPKTGKGYVVNLQHRGNSDPYVVTRRMVMMSCM